LPGWAQHRIAGCVGAVQQDRQHQAVFDSNRRE
jgi:hypothetical protein